MIRVLKEGIQAMKMATPTSTQDQFIAFTIDPGLEHTRVSLIHNALF